VSAPRVPFAIAVAGLLAAACGYRLAGSARPFGPEVRSIELRPFVNRTDEPDLERMLSDALVEEFDRRGALRPATSLASGDPGLRLSGTVQEFSVRPVAFSSVGLALEHEIRLVVRLDLARTGSDEPLWRNYRLSLTERFLGSADPGVHESNREQALRRMTSALAGRVHDAVFQTF
jgi:hypothetical protein